LRIACSGNAQLFRIAAESVTRREYCGLKKKSGSRKLSFKRQSFDSHPEFFCVLLQVSLQFQVHPVTEHMAGMAGIFLRVLFQIPSNPAQVMEKAHLRVVAVVQHRITSFCSPPEQDYLNLPSNDRFNLRVLLFEIVQQ
jgi:hypothetical protein